MENNIVSRIKTLCTEHHMSIRRLEEDLGFGTSTIKKWENSSPSVDKIIKIAEYYDVSVDYLLGITEVRSQMNDVLQNQDIVSFQRAREKMTNDERERMMQMLKLGFQHAFSEGSNEK